MQSFRVVSASTFRASFWWGFIAGNIAVRSAASILRGSTIIPRDLCAYIMHQLSHSTLFARLYCYAQKHVRSIRAVTRTGHDESHQHVPQPNGRRFVGKKKFIIKRSPHQLAAYNTSDRKAAVTVGVIMGTFLCKFCRKTDDWQLHSG